MNLNKTTKKNSYEAFVIYHFMELMKEYLGGFHSAVRKLKTRPNWRFCRCLCVIKPGELLFTS